MKNTILTLLLFAIITPVVAQVGGTVPILRQNKVASVSERVGISDVKITYNRPGVRGREGHIWGEVVHYGFEDLHYGTSKSAPWRAGADENTTIEVSTDVQIEGKTLPAGKYGFFIAMGKDKATLVFSKDNNAWGSFYYKPEHDALRVDVPVLNSTESVERLKYEFTDQTDNTAVITMHWEKIKIPFKISMDLVKEQVDAYRREFDNGNFYAYWQKMQTAANYCLINNVNLEEALTWADRSINTYFGETNFLTLSTYAGLLEKLNQKKKADSIMRKALPMGTVLQLNSYGRNLLRQGKKKEAFDIFKLNYDKEPNNLYTRLGMVFGYSNIGNTKEALVFAQKTIDISGDANTKAYVDKLIADMKAGKTLTP
ncbi:MAG TPA: DUF2911 domain-containing protein [Cyclobacteriaceae bacterium]|nr:DUF2911 domain-containing protein [Cyclobacteriaceae bacterium]